MGDIALCFCFLKNPKLDPAGQLYSPTQIQPKSRRIGLSDGQGCLEEASPPQREENTRE